MLGASRRFEGTLVPPFSRVLHGLLDPDCTKRRKQLTRRFQSSISRSVAGSSQFPFTYLAVYQALLLLSSSNTAGNGRPVTVHPKCIAVFCLSEPPANVHWPVGCYREALSRWLSLERFRLVT